MSAVALSFTLVLDMFRLTMHLILEIKLTDAIKMSLLMILRRCEEYDTFQAI